MGNQNVTDEIQRKANSIKPHTGRQKTGDDCDLSDAKLIRTAVPSIRRERDFNAFFGVIRSTSVKDSDAKNVEIISVTTGTVH